jgi:hypothetical protein
MMNDLMLWYRSKHVLRWCSVGNTIRTQAILAKGFRGVPQSLQANAGIVPQ